MSYARVYLGVGREEFLDMTPRYFDRLVRRQSDRVQHDEFMLAQIASLISLRVHKKPRTPDDLMPSRAKAGKRALGKAQILTPEERAAKLDATWKLMDAMAGVEKGTT